MAGVHVLPFLQASLKEVRLRKELRKILDTNFLALKDLVLSFHNVLLK
jgi:hypothetical protein